MEVYVGGRAQGKLDYVRGRYPEKGRIVFGESAGVEDCLCLLYTSDAADE